MRSALEVGFRHEQEIVGAVKQIEAWVPVDELARKYGVAEKTMALGSTLEPVVPETLPGLTRHGVARRRRRGRLDAREVPLSPTASWRTTEPLVLRMPCSPGSGSSCCDHGGSFVWKSGRPGPGRGAMQGLLSTIDAWCRGLTGDRVPAVVLGASVNGLSFARSLGRRRVPVLLLDSQKKSGSYTRFATTAELDTPESRAEPWIEMLLQLGRRLPRRAVLFPTSDAFCVLVAESPQLRECYDFILPERSTLERIVDKHLQYQDAAAAGVPIPRTCYPADTDEARRLAKDLGYPCIVKPYKSHERRRLSFSGKVALVSSPSELARELDRFEGQALEVMLQEIVPGGDDELFGYLGFWDGEGRERAWLTKRKLRQSTRFGDGSFQEAVLEPQIAELSRRLLGAIGYRGFVGVEFRFDRRDGSYRLIEINPRTVSGNQLAISAGVDFPWLGYLYSTGQLGETPASAFRPGTRYVNELWDLRAFLRLRKTDGLRFGSWMRSLITADAHALGAWDDPMPLLRTTGRLALTAVQGESRKLVSTRRRD